MFREINYSGSFAQQFPQQNIASHIQLILVVCWGEIEITYT